MEWNLRQVTTPDKVVTLDEIKQQLRIDHDEEDDLLERLIRAAQDTVEGPRGIGLMLSQQTWELHLDRFPAEIHLPLYPIKSVDEIRYQGDGEQVLDADEYQVDTVSNPARIIPCERWPKTRRRTLNAVTVEFTGGYDEVPEDLRHVVILMASHFYENRQPVALGTSATDLPMSVESILGRYRVAGVA